MLKPCMGLTRGAFIAGLSRLVRWHCGIFLFPKALQRHRFMKNVGIFLNHILRTIQCNQRRGSTFFSRRVAKPGFRSDGSEFMVQCSGCRL